MHQDVFAWLLSQLLLPLFVVALLFGLVGVGADVVVKAGASILISIVQALFKLAHAILDALIGVLKKETKPSRK